MTQETKHAVVKYQSKDGQTITLTFETIRKYLVQGHSEYVTEQELMYFCGVCKSRGMNPFKRDCYLIKYSQKDAAAIITSIDFLRSRGKSMEDCAGWEAGVILLRGKEVVYSKGLVLENDILLGGWSRGKPKGWDIERMVEVNLKGYIKYTQDGRITSFWKEDKQPTQIAKVAESQLIRAIWPDEFQNLYTDAEISPGDDVKLLSDKEVKPGGEEDRTDAITKFDTSIPKDVNLEAVQKYLATSSEHFKISVDEIKADATENLDHFWTAFRSWAAKQKPGKESVKDREVDAIRRLYKGLGDRNFVKFVDSCKDEIPTYPQVNQDEIHASWKKRFKTPFPGSEQNDKDDSSPNLPDDDEAPKTEKVEVDEDQQILDLVDGAEKGPFLSGVAIFVKCPSREDDDKPTTKWCQQNCNTREKCPSWGEFDKVAGK